MPALGDVRAAAKAIAPYVVRTPLIRLNVSGYTGEILLKLENLQAIGVFKARPIANILLNARPELLQTGVYTASSGNAGLALAWMARKLDLAAKIYMPDFTPADKVAAIRNLGATIQQLPGQEWWEIILNGGHAHDPGMYVDAVRNPLAIAGSGTIGVEIAEQAPDADSVIVPFGGGGLSCGIAAAIRAVKPDMRVIVAESDAAAPLTAALRAGRPVPVNMQQSFIFGAGAPIVLREMWPLINGLIDDSVVVTVSAVASAVRELFTTAKVIAEGAGAISVAGALSAGRVFRKTVCVVSGGNINSDTLTAILRGPK